MAVGQLLVPAGQVVNFKRDVYRKAMVELCNQLPQKKP